MSVDQAQFLEASRQKGVQPFMTVLEPFLPNSGLAYDVGCGAGKEAVFLAERGWEVIAIDLQPEAAKLWSAHKSITWHNTRVSEVDFLPCDLVLGCFSFFFMPQEEFVDILAKAKQSLKQDGILAGQFLGPNDDWAEECWTVTTEALQALLKDFQILHHEEVCRTGKTVWGEPKNWHIHHVIARLSSIESE